MTIDAKGQWIYHGGRNPRAIPLTFNGVLAPAAETVRQTYQVPENRRAMLIMGDLITTRISDATVQDNAVAALHITRSQQARQTLLTVAFVTNTNNMVLHSGLYFGLPLYPRDLITLTTADASTDGTVLFNLNASVVEFDVLLKPGV